MTRKDGEALAVIGKDINQIYVKHGGSYLRVNPCHIRPVKRSEPSGKIQEEEEETSVNDGGRKHQVETEQICESEKDVKVYLTKEERTLFLLPLMLLKDRISVVIQSRISIPR